jgi:membrane-bound lytic murein transglycosylase B
MNTHAVDFDGDGRRDIWNSSADALASTAHYLQSSGWQKGQPWGFEVQQLPTNFDYALADGVVRKPVGEWLKLGLQVHGRCQRAAQRQSTLSRRPAAAGGPSWPGVPGAG